MFTSHKQISPPSLVLKLKISEVSQKWIPKAVELKRIPTHKKCKCKKFCSQTRLVGEIYSSDVIMHRGYSSAPFIAFYRAANNIFFSRERKYILLRHHLGRTELNFGRTSPKKVSTLCTLYLGRFLFFLAVKWCKISGYDVRKQVGFRRTPANFGRPMFDDRLLFAVLFLLSISLLWFSCYLSWTFLHIWTCVAAYVQVGTLYAPMGVMLVTGQEISPVFTFSDSPDL